jgi:hypothetical protein
MVEYKDALPPEEAAVVENSDGPEPEEEEEDECQDE